jgi:hypothetical protein
MLVPAAAEAELDALPEPCLQAIEGLPARVACIAATTDAALTAMFAVDAEGVLYCWGTAAAARAGLMGSSCAPCPQPVPMPAFARHGIRVTKVACGPRHAVALTTTGCVYVWGANETGGLGLGDLRPRTAPTLVAAYSNPALVSQVPAELTDPEHSDPTYEPELPPNRIPAILPAFGLAIAMHTAHHIMPNPAAQQKPPEPPTTDAPVKTEPTLVVDWNIVIDVDCIGNAVALLLKNGDCVTTEVSSTFTPKSEVL